VSDPDRERRGVQTRPLESVPPSSRTMAFSLLA
jgi:hypothetical protein